MLFSTLYLISVIFAEILNFMIVTDSNCLLPLSDYNITLLGVLAKSASMGHD